MDLREFGRIGPPPTKLKGIPAASFAAPRQNFALKWDNRLRGEWSWLARTTGFCRSKIPLYVNRHQPAGKVKEPLLHRREKAHLASK